MQHSVYHLCDCAVILRVNSEELKQSNQLRFSSQRHAGAQSEPTCAGEMYFHRIFTLKTLIPGRESVTGALANTNLLQ